MNPNNTPEMGTYGTDSQLLEGLLEYLDEWQGAALQVADVMNAKPAGREKRRARFEKDFEVSPEGALKNALDGLTAETLSIRAKRMLRDGEQGEGGELEAE